MWILPVLAALSLSPVFFSAPASAAAPAGLGPTATGYGGAGGTGGPPPTPRGPRAPRPGGKAGDAGAAAAPAPAVGLEVLRGGATGVAAAAAAAAPLGVTEPFSAGIGGGGFLVYYDARHHRVATIDGRETGPAMMTSTYFIDPADGQPYD